MLIPGIVTPLIIALSVSHGRREERPPQESTRQARSEILTPENNKSDDQIAKLRVDLVGLK